MPFTGGGRRYEFRPDGTGVERQDNVVTTSHFRGNELRVVGNGTIDFTWTANDHAITYLAQTAATIQWSFYDQRGLISTQPLTLNPALNEVDDFTCAGTQATESNATGYRSSWARTTGPGSGTYG